MKMRNFVCGTTVAMAAWAICLPQIAFAAEPAAASPVVDIAMADGGVLHGQVVDLRGAGTPGVPVVVKAQNQPMVRTVSTTDGHFEVKNLRGGVYQVAAGENQNVFRVWSAKAAPPSAKKTAVVYTGLGGGGGFKTLLANPVVIAGVVATAIAVPVAVANNRPSSP